MLSYRSLHVVACLGLLASIDLRISAQSLSSLHLETLVPFMAYGPRAVFIQSRDGDGLGPVAMQRGIDGDTSRMRLKRSLASENLRSSVQRAGIIFIGTVSAIVLETKVEDPPTTYRITFQVENGLRGVRSGTLLTIREWAGLWATPYARNQCYRLGERVVLFLYPMSRAGVTSPVGGQKGKLRVSSGGSVVLPADWADIWARKPRRPRRPDRNRETARTPVEVLAWRLARRVREVQGN